MIDQPATRMAYSSASRNEKVRRLTLAREPIRKLIKLTAKKIELLVQLDEALEQEIARVREAPPFKGW